MKLLLIIIVSYLVLGFISTSIIYYSIYREDPEGLKRKAESVGYTVTQYIIKSILYATPIWIYLWYITIKTYKYKVNIEKKVFLVERLREIKEEMEKLSNIEEPTFEHMIKSKELLDEFMSIKKQLEKED